MGSVLNYGQTAAAAHNGYGMKLYVCRNDGMKLYVYRNAHFTYLRCTCCPALRTPTLVAFCVEPHPFRSMEHTTASEAPDEHTLATAVPGSSDPTLTRGEGALPTFRPTRHAGSDGPVLWCPSAAPRAGDTAGQDRAAKRRERAGAAWLAAAWRARGRASG